MLPVGHQSSFGELYFSPGGNLAATTAFKDKMVAVWDVRTGKLLGTFSDTSAFRGVGSVNFSKDGKKMITRGGSVMTWDLERKKFLQEVYEDQNDIGEEFSSNIVMSPDGNRIAYAKDSAVFITELANSRVLAELKDRTGVIDYLEYSPDGKWLAGINNTELIVWNTADNTVSTRLQNADKLFFSGDSRKMISITPENIRIYSAGEWYLLKEIEVESPGAFSFSPDGKRMMFTLGHVEFQQTATSAVLFDLDSMAIIRQWDKISSGWLHPDNETVIILKEELFKSPNQDDPFPTRVEVWNGRTNKLTRTWIDSVSTKLSPGGDKMGSVTDQMNNKMVRIINVKTGNILQEWNWQGHIPNYSQKFRPDGKKLLTYDAYINIWDPETATILNSALVGIETEEWESTTSVRFAAYGSKFLVNQKTDWQVWSADENRMLLSSKLKFNGEIIASISDDGKQAAFIYQNERQADIELYDLVQLKKMKSFPMGSLRVRSLTFTPDNSRLILSDAEKNKTEIRLLSNFSLVKKLIGVFEGSFSHDGKKMITVDENRDDDGALVFENIRSYIWDIQNGKLVESIEGTANFSPKDNKIVTTCGKILDLDKPGSLIVRGQHKDVLDTATICYNPESFGVSQEIYFSPDGKKIIEVTINSGSAGNFPGVMVWDAMDWRLIHPVDTTDETPYNEYISPSGKKLLRDCINEDEDLLVIDLDRRDTIRLTGSMDGKRLLYAEFSPDDKYLYTSNDQTIKKWEVETGRLLFTFFPVDSTAYLSSIPSGYYSCSPEAAKTLHYVKGMQVISFEQLDIRYNRPDKVLEHIGHPDKTLIAAYRQAYLKRIKKLGIDTTHFREGTNVPEADFIGRDAIDEQSQENLSLTIKARDSVYQLDRFNIWINGIPLFGFRGHTFRRGTYQFDTTITVKLSRGENRIETSVTNLNGVESYRSPLVVQYKPARPGKETAYFIGIGIDRFADSRYNLLYSVKDIRDLAKKLKKSYGTRLVIDTLFNTGFTKENISALKQKLLGTNVNDRVIIAYSGHGMLSKQFDYYLSSYTVDFAQPEKNGISYDILENLIDSIPARKKLMLIDACHSGEVDKDEMVVIDSTAGAMKLIKGLKPVAYKNKDQLGLKNSFELMQRLFVNAGKNTGATVISAASGTQLALERYDLKNGVFTYSILEAMNKNKTLTVSSLKKIVSARVSELTRGLQQPTSRVENIAVDWRVW